MKLNISHGRYLALVWFLSVIMTGWVPGATLDDIRFRAPFDGSADAELATGKPTPSRVSGDLQYEPGRFGQALVGGEQGAIAEYRIESNLDVKQGGLSLWFNPVNWQPGEMRSHVLFRFRYGSIFRLFIDEVGRLVFEVGPDLVERCRASASIKHLRQGDWAHVVATWSANEREIRLYVDGQLADAVQCDDRFLPLVVNYDFQVGDIPRARGRETPRRTLIDDLTIFRRPIAPDEFGRVEADSSGRETPDSQPPTMLTARCTPVPSQGICNVLLKEESPTVLAAEPTAVAELIRHGETQPARTVRFDSFSDGSATGRFEIANLPSGDYELRVRVEKEGRTLDRTAIDFVKPHEPWRQLKVGHSDTPPPPWTPMQSNFQAGELEISCWNRSHHFRGPLPMTIQNGQIQQLAAPMQLHAQVAGEAVAWRDAKISNVQHTSTKVSFESTMHGGPLSASSQTYMEYDGMLWCEITVTPDAPTLLDALDLVVPLKAEFGSLMHAPRDVYYTGKTGSEVGWTLDHDAHQFFMWLGNEDLGFTWFFERRSQQQFADKDKFVRFERHGDRMLFKVRYVDQPVTLDKPFTLKFGLQATPVRSRPAGWRNWGEPRSVGNSIVIPWTDEYLDRYGAGYPEATSPAFYSRYVQNRKRYGRVTPYKLMLWHGIQSPEWQYNAADWDLGGGVNKYSDTRPFWWGGRVCGAADTFIDFATWKYRAHIHEHQLDGVYHDLQWNYRCSNPNHGCAPSRRSIRGDRELNKRLYTTLQQFDRPVIKVDHASNQACSAFSAFGDLFTTGEEMCAGSEEPQKPHHRVWDDYFNVMRIDYFKACGAMGRQLGVVPMFLLQMKQPNEWATEAIFSILLAHDAIPTWDAYPRDVRFMSRLWRLLEDFDIGHAAIEFLPYWHESTPAKVVKFTPDGDGPIRPVRINAYEPKLWQTLESDESYGASVYHLTGRRSLVVVFNYTQDDAMAVVQLDVNALGFSPDNAMATDAFTRFQWVRVDQPLELKVRTRNFRLIWVEPRDESPADAFPDPPDKLQPLAGAWTWPDESGQRGEQIVGDLWEDPFVHGDDPYRPSDPTGTEVAVVFDLDRPTRLERIDIRMRHAGVRGPDTREPIQLKLVSVDEAGQPTDREIIDARSFTWQWVDTNGQNARYDLKQSRLLPAGRYAALLFKWPEDQGEYYHALVPTYPVKDDGAYLVTRIVPGGAWRRLEATTAFGVFGQTAP